MERLTLHSITSAFDYAKNHLSQEEAAKVYARLAELEDKIESGQLVEAKQYYIKPEKLRIGKVRYLICRNDITKGVYDICDTLSQAEKRLQEPRGKKCKYLKMKFTNSKEST